MDNFFMAHVIDFPIAPQTTATPGLVFFERRELDLILRLYGTMVALGEWRDYAIGQTRDACVFSVFRRTSDGALYQIVKSPQSARRQGAYCVQTGSGRILKRGHNLAMVLKLFDRMKLRLIED